MTGNRALAWGLLAAAERTKVPVVFGAYPITPASDILHELALHKRFRVRTFQAEDEIAAVTAAIGASFGGCIGVTASSGPGIALKGEAIGLAVTAELPLVIFDIQRGGPSTGLPTKTEQADLMQALYGRNSESPVVVIAPATPGDCFYIAYEAVRLAIKYMVPVMVLSDGYLANGSEPWLIPDPKTLPEITVGFRTEVEGFFPYLRDPATLARPWVRPGTPGLEHRIGGIEKQDVTGNISYDPENHDHMVRTRAEKVRRVGQEIPPTSINGPATGEVLVVGWGGTYGAITAAVEEAQAEGKAVASVHLRYLNPLPPDLGHILRQYRRVLVPEINSGQLVRILRAASTECAACRSRARRSSKPSTNCWRPSGEPCDRSTRSDPEVHQEGFRVRPGRALVPRLRGLRDPERGAEDDARPRHPEGGHRVHLRDRLLEPLPVLHEHLRLPHHSRPGPRRRHRPQAGAARAQDLRRHR
jgi:2-oxoglutarate ferredoxin oxidoreductase subunit alpha